MGAAVHELYLRELALNIGSLVISPITVTAETHDPRYFLVEEAEMLPTDQLQLVLSSEEKQVPV